MTGEGNPGMNKLANTLAGRIYKQTESPLILDFGVINPDYSLTANTFPVPIPRSSYSICKPITGLSVEGSILPNEGEPEPHIHKLELSGGIEGIKAGDRVLVAWVQSEAIVIGIALSAERL